MIKTDFKNIPEELKQYAQFVVWRRVEKEPGKWAKIPYDPKTDKAASTINPEHWGNYNDAIDAYLFGEYDGIGFVFSTSDPFVGVDLDHCVEDAGLDADAARVVRDFKSYAEISPSGTGVHVIARGSIPRGRINKKEGREVYDTGRFFTLTGAIIDDYNEIETSSETLSHYYGKWFPDHYDSATAADYHYDAANVTADLQRLHLPEDVRALIEKGSGMDRFKNDHSEAMWWTCRELLVLGVNTDTILYHLTKPGNYLADNGPLAEHRRDGDVESGRRWLWRYILGPREAALAAFIDEAFDVIEPEPPKRYAPEMHAVPPMEELAKVKPRRFLMGSRFSAGQVTLGVADSATGKSMLSLMSALAIATGRELTGEKVHRQGAAWVINQEDDKADMHRRLYALGLRYGIKNSEYRDKLFISTRDDNRLLLLRRAHQGGPAMRSKAVADIIEDIRANHIAYIALDPLVRLHSGLNENDNADMDELVDTLTYIARETGVAIDLIHHSSKANSGSAGLYGGRGASSLVTGVRTVYTLARMTQAEATEFAISEREKNRSFRLTDTKNNHAKLGGADRWFQFESVDLLNGDEEFPSDSVGVPVHMPEVNDEDAVEARLEAKKEAKKSSISRNIDEILLATVEAYPSFEKPPSLRKLAERIETKVKPSRTQIEDLLKTMVGQPQNIETPLGDNFEILIKEQSARGGKTARRIEVHPVQKIFNLPRTEAKTHTEID
nr:hypothetical protein 13 [bacterium]